MRVKPKVSLLLPNFDWAAAEFATEPVPVPILNRLALGEIQKKSAYTLQAANWVKNCGERTAKERYDLEMRLRVESVRIKYRGNVWAFLLERLGWPE